MANNYTITSSVTQENVGDSVVNGTIPSSVELTITPDTGFVLQASDFSIGTTLPIEVASVSFADTGTALDPTNTVVATVNLASWYTMPNNSDVINIDIDGRTQGFKPRLNFTSVVAVDANFNAVLSAEGGTGSITSSTVDSIKTDTYSGMVDQNKNTLVCTMNISLADSLKHMASQPSYRLSSSDSSRWGSTTSPTYDSENQLTGIVYSFYYNMGGSDIDTSLGESIIWSLPSVVENNKTIKHISGAYYTNYENESILPAENTDLQLNVVGSETGDYDIKIEDTNGLTYDFSTNTFTREQTSSGIQRIYSKEQQELLGRVAYLNSHTISFPAYFKESGYDFHFKTTITPSDWSNASGTSTDPHVITLRQFGEVDCVLSTTAGTYGTTVADTVIKSITNGIPLSTLSSFIPADFPTRSTSNNGYFSSTQALGYTVNGTVSSHTHVSTSVVLTATSATLKLQTGDSVTGTGIATDTTITVDGTSTIVLSKSSTETITGTLVFTRTVGISRQPLATDIHNVIPTASYSPYYYDFSVIESTTNSTLVKVDPTDATNISVGMLVEGYNVIGYPTVVSHSNGIVELSQAQTISIGENLTFSAGRSLDISRLEVTGAGTAACKLIVEGSVLRMGYGDTLDALILANFITTYAAPTIVAATATCTLDSSITIEPLSGCTTHTGVLTIEAIGVVGKGNAKISDNKQSILYVAPTSGSSDTITYTISDGVSATTSAQNIVVTLRP